MKLDLVAVYHSLHCFYELFKKIEAKRSIDVIGHRCGKKRLLFSYAHVKSKSMKPTYEMLLEENRLLKEENKRLLRIIAKLEKRIEELEARLHLNSKNSSKPPSSDQKPNGEQKAVSERPARKGFHRALLPITEVTRFERLAIETCPHCLCATESTGRTHVTQQVELPEIKLDVLQVEREVRRCLCCKQEFTPALPREYRFAFGSRLEGLQHLLCSKFRLSHNKVKELLTTLLPALSISKGEIALGKRRTERVFQAAQDILKQEMLSGEHPIHADCTGWRHRAKNHHLLVLCSSKGVFFQILEHQNQATLSAVFGDNFDKTLVSDRGFSYKPCARQYCLAHLKRNLLGLLEKIKDNPRICEKINRMLTLLKSVHSDTFGLRSGQLQQSTWLNNAAEKWGEMHDLADSLSLERDVIVKKFFERVYREWRFFTAYLRDRLIPMTNNAAEQALRDLVIARKLSFGSKSDYGRTWIASIHGCLMTWKKAGYNLLEKVQEAVILSRQKAPVSIT